MSNQIRVVHVEDEVDFAELTAEFLEREDDRIAVESMTNPVTAIDRISDIRVDCVVSDFDMPQMNGIELLKSVREEHPELPFILFTGKGSEEIASEAISAGVTDYLQKGGSDEYVILANRVRTIVEGHRSKTEANRYLELLEGALAKTETYVWEWDLTTGEVTRYPSKSALSQLSSSDIGDVFDGFLERVHPDERARVEQIIEEGIANGTGYHFECRFRDTDGSYRWIRDRSEVKMEQGEPVRAIGMVTDITGVVDRHERFDGKAGPERD